MAAATTDGDGPPPLAPLAPAATPITAVLIPAAEEEDELEALIPQAPAPAAGGGEEEDELLAAYRDLQSSQGQQGQQAGEEDEAPPEALDARALMARCEGRLRRIEAALGEYEAASGPRLAAFRKGVEDAHAAKEPKIIPHARQSYFGPYFLDEKGSHPPLVGQSRVVAQQVRRLQEAREEQTQWTTSEEKKLKYLVLEEKVKARARLGLGPAGKDGAAPLMGRMATKAQFEEDKKVEAEVDWRKVADALKPFQPKRLRARGRPRSLKEVVAHWRNKIAAPEKFTREEARRLMALAAQHERHGWEAVAREMATGHSAIQCLREHQRRAALLAPDAQGGGGGGGTLYKRGPWTQEEDARLAEAVGMYADNWTLISQHVGSRTAPQCRHRRASQLLNKSPFTREEQMRVVLASVAYCPETWAAPGDKDGAKRLLRAFETGPGLGGEGEEGGYDPWVARKGRKWGAMKGQGKRGGKRKRRRLGGGDGEEEDGEGEGEEESLGAGGGGEREYGTAWSNVAEHLPTRTDAQCRARWLNTLHPLKAKGEWGEEELDRLWEVVQAVGAGDWVRVAKELGTGRTRMQVKQCQKRLAKLDALARQREAAAAAAAGAAKEEVEEEEEGVGGGGGDDGAHGQTGGVVGGSSGGEGGGDKQKRPRAAAAEEEDDEVSSAAGRGRGEEEEEEESVALELDERVQIARRPNGRPYAVVGDTLVASLAGSALGPFAIAGTSTTRLPLKKKKKKGSANKAKAGDGEGGKARRTKGEGGKGEEGEEDDDPPPEVKPAPKKIGRPRKSLEEKRATRRAIKKRARERARLKRLEERRRLKVEEEGEGSTTLEDIPPDPAAGEAGPGVAAAPVLAAVPKDGRVGGGGGGKNKAKGKAKAKATKGAKAGEGEGGGGGGKKRARAAVAVAAGGAEGADDGGLDASAAGAEPAAAAAEEEPPPAKRTKTKATATGAAGGGGDVSVATSGGASSGGRGRKRGAAAVELSDEDEEERKKGKARAEARAARAKARGARFGVEE